MSVKRGTYIREPDGAMLLYHSPFYYIDAAHAFRRRNWNRNDFSAVHDKEELKRFASLKPGEYVENDWKFVSCIRNQGCVDAYTCSQQRSKTKDSSWCLYRRDDLELKENDD